MQLLYSAESRNPAPCVGTPLSQETHLQLGAALHGAPCPGQSVSLSPLSPTLGAPGEPLHTCAAATQAALTSTPATLLPAFASSRNCFDLHSRGSLLKINVSWMLLPMA